MINENSNYPDLEIGSAMEPPYFYGPLGEKKNNTIDGYPKGFDTSECAALLSN